jgi:dihydrodipicolinate synthase/N-acetylneuraminate lyase
MSMTVNERKAVAEAWVTARKETNQIIMVQVGGACLKDVQELVNSTSLQTLTAQAQSLTVDTALIHFCPLPILTAYCHKNHHSNLLTH